MTDLAEYRALAAAARADTSDGLLAREKLPDVVDALCAQIDGMREPGVAPQIEWANRLTRGGGHEVALAGPSSEGGGERLARHRMQYEWYTALLRRTVTYGPWVEVPVSSEAGDD